MNINEPNFFEGQGCEFFHKVKVARRYMNINETNFYEGEGCEFTQGEGCQEGYEY